MPHEAEQWVEVGYVQRAHGIRGELRIKLHNQDSDVLSSLNEVLLRHGDSSEQVVRIAKKRPTTPGIVLLSVEGVSDRNTSETLKGATLLIPRRALPDVDKDEFYVHDILQALVVDIDGVEVGRVVDYLHYPSADVLIVQGSKRYEIPVIKDFVHKIDTEHARIVVANIDDFETT